MKLSISKDLDALRVSALARLDDAVAQHLADLTSSPIALVRARKADEAARILAGADASAAPLLCAELPAGGQGLISLATIVAGKAADTVKAIAAIETARQARQAAIRAAPHPAAINAALLGDGNGQ